MFRTIISWGTITALAAAQGAAVSAQSTAPMAGATRSEASQGVPAASGTARGPGGYVLGSGDRVRITVYGEDRLSGEYAVTSTGEISFPLIGNLKATGRTVADLQTTIHDRLSSGYLKDPRVTAEILTFRPFYVLGEVARPGQIPYVDGLTLRQALAAAGGFTYRAKRSKVYVMPQGQTTETEVDLRKEPGRPIMPGDTIRIAERFF